MNKKEIAVEVLATKILLVRGKKVMLDRDLAGLYGVGTRDLNKAVKRNLQRFPKDFMFQLTKQETKNLMFQFGTSSWGGMRKLPYVFTEQGVAMLSSVLKSERSIWVNIAIMRAFVKLRELLLTHKELAEKLEELERKYQLHETDIQVILGLLRNVSKLSFSGLTGESRNFYRRAFRFLDSRFRGNDGFKVFRNSPIFEAIKRLIEPPPEAPKPRFDLN